ncbi:MAG TPA: phosphatidate cytidylyltransferase [Kouleothrix sp.]|uniref:phosphatidate cytidylyltransferase n=1 Tax=Kouleothrix sp. TaxID=2779161 RepID=UPI002C335023|nr:phosphatidate cytidylyltransferase [Kouleothrix sp.]HRC74080.1 phosphatidate cytidylyltransferase [Kouleothrix sp.]
MDSANAASAASPRNKSSLAQRVISALILLPIVIGLVWWGVWPIVVLVVAATVVGLLELYGAFAQGGYRPRVAVGIALALALIGAVTLRATTSLDLVMPLITLAIVASLVFELTRHSERGGVASWALTLAGAFYLGWLFSQFIPLRMLSSALRPNLFTLLGLPLDSGAAWIYLILAITWIQDTAAYFVGKYTGRHKMAPILSPKKTWEGAVGGLVGSVLASVGFAVVFGLPINTAQALFLGLVGGIVGPLGDLAESMIKRQVGLKDAGNLIPGHGGILDRADSLLFTGPVLYYLIKLLLV